MTPCAAFWKRRWEAPGYDVVAYDNGKDAYDRLREEPFTLLLTDIVMPEMDGIELARGPPRSIRTSR
jgi:two-component system cell cycle response regulator CpdR